MKVGVIEKGRSGTEYICSECGSVMEEVDRVNENGFTFIWYKCVRVGCGEQWLEKRAMLCPAPASLVDVRSRQSA
jgi:acetone carboxylase gamma subunit